MPSAEQRDRLKELLVVPAGARRSALDRLRRGPTQPTPSGLVEALRRSDGFRLAALECGRVVGVARVDQAGEMFIAVTADRRGAGIGTTLGHAAVQRAAYLGHRRVVLRTTRRSGAARRVGEQLGGTIVERARGRADLVLEPARHMRHSA
jgi:GNAT superfamily N-acetyltransferase